MTILKIWLMTHYSAVAEPYAIRHSGHAYSLAVHKQRQELIDLGLLRLDDSWQSGYRVTERGQAYVNSLQELAP